MEYIRYYSTIILWARPFALSGIIRNYDDEFPSKIARTLFHRNNISYVGRMIIRPSNESRRSRTIDIYVRCFPDSLPRGTHFHTTPASISSLKSVQFPQYPSIEAYDDPVSDIRTLELGDLANKYLRQYASRKKGTDKVFGLRSTDEYFYIGEKRISLDGDDITVRAR